MKTRTKNVFVSVMIALSFAFALALVVRAQATAESPAPIVAPEPTAAPAPSKPVSLKTAKETGEATSVDKAKIAATESTQSESKVDQTANSGLRRLDDSESVTAADSEDVEMTKTVSVIIDLSDEDEGVVVDLDTVIEELLDEEWHKNNRGQEWHSFGDTTVPSGTVASEVVTFMGDTVLKGESVSEVVSIFGNTTVMGKAGGWVWAIFGDVYIDGEVGGEVVAVFGSVTLGSKAVVNGEVFVVGGQLLRDDNAIVHGGVQEIHLMGDQANLDALRLWIHECLLYGRPLAFNSGLQWAWVLAGGVLAFYVLLALMIPQGINKCVETLEERPGYSTLAVLLSVLAIPILTILLAVTGVGVLLLPFIFMGVFFGTVFGKAVMSAWLGRRFTRHFGDGALNHAAVATLVGGILVLLLYTVPFLGFFIWKVFGVIGWGVVIYTLILEMRKNRPIPAPPSSSTAVAEGGVANTDEPQPPELPLTSMPRVGFWMRIAATLIDVIVVGIVGSILFLSEWFLLLFAVYCALLWVTKGTTIGGIVFGLKIVRLDEGPVDWSVSIVRVLAGFLSLVVAGLGFIWVAFDPEKQSWHDKIAGTIVVRTPRGGSLV